MVHRPSGGHLDLSQASQTASSIKAALDLCSEAAKGKLMSPEAQQQAEQILCLPIAASCVLASASIHLQSSQKWREMASHQSVGTCFHALIGIVIPRQPLLLFKVCFHFPLIWRLHLSCLPDMSSACVVKALPEVLMMQSSQKTLSVSGQMQ